MPNEQNEVISKAELARRLNRSKPMITRYCRQGCPVRPDGLIDWFAARDWFASNVLSERSGSYSHDELVRAGKSAMGGKPAGKPAAGTNGTKADRGPDPDHGPGETIASLQRKKLRVEIETRQLSLLRERCLVVPLAAVNAHFAAVITQVRNRLLHLPAQLADRFGVLTGPECAALLDSELRVILSSLSKYQPPERPEERTTGQADTAEAAQ